MATAPQQVSPFPLSTMKLPDSSSQLRAGTPLLMHGAREGGSVLSASSMRAGGVSTLTKVPM